MFRIFHGVRWAVKREKDFSPWLFEEKAGGFGFLSFLGIRMKPDLTGAHVAQLVEHILGKDEVISSILIMGSILRSGY